MKKLIIALTCAAVLSACGRNHQSDKSTTRMTDKEYNSLKFGSIVVVTLDSCEYVINKYGNSGGICHKGNCKNPIHCKIIEREVDHDN